MRLDNDFISTPVIRLEINHMKRTMISALTEYNAQLDQDLKTAIESYCQPDNLKRIIEEETHRVLDGVIKEEVKNWFVHGEGRKVIKSAVEKNLRENTTYTPLDD
jgi:hypothetical protein